MAMLNNQRVTWFNQQKKEIHHDSPRTRKISDKASNLQWLIQRWNLGDHPTEVHTSKRTVTRTSLAISFPAASKRLQWLQHTKWRQYGSYISISFPGTVRLSRWWNGLKWCGREWIWHELTNIKRRVNLKSAGFHVQCVLEATQAPVGHSSPSNLLPWEVDVWTDRLIYWQIDRWIDR